MATYINEDFKPDANTLNLLRKKGVFQDFCDHIMPHFMTYWLDLKNQGKAQGKKTSWQSTFLNWAIRAHQGRVGKEYEENKHRRYDNGGLKNDLFSAVGESLKNGVPPSPNRAGELTESRPSPGGSRKTRQLIPQPIPGEGQTMTFEEAQAELKKMKII